MNRTQVSTHYQNISNNERVFRTVFGLAILTTVSTGIVTVPTAIFTISMIAVYQVLTAIIGIDPVYSLSNALSGLRARKPGKLVTT
jgi:Inner membrane protein YgaP-like, transmembrane domain